MAGQLHPNKLLRVCHARRGNINHVTCDVELVIATTVLTISVVQWIPKQIRCSYFETEK